MGIRSFIAINLSESVKDVLKDVEDKFRKTLRKSKISWVKKDNFHITLRFLGDIEGKDVDRIKEFMREFVKGHGKFKINFYEIGVFPGLKRPRVLWVGGDYPEALKSLYTEFSLQFEKMGFPEDKPFLPHVTLGRIKYLNKSEKESFTREIESISFECEDIVESIELMKSQLAPGGSIYTVLESFQLK